MRLCAVFLLLAFYAVAIMSGMTGWWPFVGAALFVVLMTAAVLRWVALGGLDDMTSEDDR
jgi:hypothetical protein